MLNLIVDTGIFAVPPYVQDENDAIHIIRRIVRWSGAVSGEAPFRLLRVAGAEEHLALAGCWPMQSDIEQMLEMFGLQNVFSINDIIVSYFDLLECASISDELELEVDNISTVTITPDALHGYGPQQIVLSTKLAYGNSCYHQSSLGRSMPIASGLPHRGPLTLAFEGNADTFFGPAGQHPPTPWKLVGNVDLLDLPEDLADFPSARVMWGHAETSRDYYLALAVGCIDLLRSGGKKATLAGLPNFLIGSDFVQSLVAVQASKTQPYAGVVFDTCVRTLLGIPKNKVSPMGKKAQEVRERDKSLGWRTHITKKHEALRLMFWTGGGALELANVATKFDTEILEGVAGEEYGFSW